MFMSMKIEEYRCTGYADYEIGYTRRLKNLLVVEAKKSSTFDAIKSVAQALFYLCTYRYRSTVLHRFIESEACCVNRARGPATFSAIRKPTGASDNQGTNAPQATPQISPPPRNTFEFQREPGEDLRSMLR